MLVNVHCAVTVVAVLYAVNVNMQKVPKNTRLCGSLTGTVQIVEMYTPVCEPLP